MLSIRESIDKIIAEGYDIPRSEQALGLPYGTFNKWKKSNKSTSTALALCNIIATYPWILKVAKGGFRNHKRELCLAVVDVISPEK